MTLLKIVRTFPWLLEVMDCNYDREKAKAIHLEHAVEELVEITERLKAVEKMGPEGLEPSTHRL